MIGAKCAVVKTFDAKSRVKNTLCPRTGHKLVKTSRMKAWLHKSSSQLLKAGKASKATP
jgi:hypothetical protein